MTYPPFFDLNEQSRRLVIRFSDALIDQNPLLLFNMFGDKCYEQLKRLTAMFETQPKPVFLPHVYDGLLQDSMFTNIIFSGDKTYDR